MTCPQPQAQQTQLHCSLKRRRKRIPSLPASAARRACAVLALVSTSWFCHLNLPAASAQPPQQVSSQSKPNYQHRVAAKTLDVDGDGSITYAEYDKILDRTNQNIHFPNSPLDDFSECDADYPTAFVEYIYLTFYNVDEPLIERTSPDDYERFLNIVKRVVNECTGEEGECINVERVEIVEDTIDTFDYDATFLDGVGHRQLQNRKKRRGKRNVKKLRVEGRNYSRRRGRLLLREKSKDRRERRQLLGLPAQQQEQLVDGHYNERGLQEGTGTCGDMLLNRLERAEVASFDCLAAIEVTSYDLRCLDEQLLEANQGPNGRQSTTNGQGLSGPMMVSAQVEDDEEEVEGPPRNRARGRENEGPSLMAGGQQPMHTALPYNASDRNDPGIQHHSNQDRPQQMAPPADTASGAGTDWTSGATYSPNHD